MKSYNTKLCRINKLLSEVELKVQEQCDKIYTLNKPYLGRYSKFTFEIHVSIYFSKFTYTTLNDINTDIDIENECVSQKFIYNPEKPNTDESCLYGNQGSLFHNFMKTNISPKQWIFASSIFTDIEMKFKKDISISY